MCCCIDVKWVTGSKFVSGNISSHHKLSQGFTYADFGNLVFLRSEQGNIILSQIEPLQCQPRGGLYFLC